ncbi:hypothetical protein BDP67DRAFT_501754 [Colletotrichum lupini]|nr:hypothetical protein BDP67DRAFT_501754 [Colletotrichum lupini]
MWEHRLRHRVRFTDSKQDFDHGELAKHWRTCVLPSSIELLIPKRHSGSLESYLPQSLAFCCRGGGTYNGFHMANFFLDINVVEGGSRSSYAGAILPGRHVHEGVFFQPSEWKSSTRQTLVAIGLARAWARPRSQRSLASRLF